MKLYFYGHEMVRQHAYPRVQSPEGLEKIKRTLVSMMERHKLRGIAAPQVGILMQLIVVKVGENDYLDLVNPYITRMYGGEPEQFETCISCPPYNNGCVVRRMSTIHLVTNSVDNVKDAKEMEFKGVAARLIQHELDHLEGTFFFDRAKIADRHEVLKRFRSWRDEWKINQKTRTEKPWQPPLQQQ